MRWAPRRWTAAALLTLATGLLALLAARPVAAQPPPAVLEALALEVADLPAGYTVFVRQHTSYAANPRDLPFYQIVYRGVDGQSVQVALGSIDPADADAPTLIDAFVAGLAAAASSLPPLITPAATPFPATRFQFLVPTPSGLLPADGVIWLHDLVLAVVIVYGSAEPDTALAHAERQESRLRTLLPVLAPSEREPAQEETPPAGAGAPAQR